MPGGHGCAPGGAKMHPRRAWMRARGWGAEMPDGEGRDDAILQDGAPGVTPGSAPSSFFDFLREGLKYERSAMGDSRGIVGSTS